VPTRRGTGKTLSELAELPTHRGVLSESARCGCHLRFLFSRITKTFPRPDIVSLAAVPGHQSPSKFLASRSPADIADVALSARISGVELIARWSGRWPVGRYASPHRGAGGALTRD